VEAFTVNVGNSCRARSGGSTWSWRPTSFRSRSLLCRRPGPGGHVSSSVRRSRAGPIRSWPPAAVPGGAAGQAAFMLMTGAAGLPPGRRTGGGRRGAGRHGRDDHDELTVLSRWPTIVRWRAAVVAADTIPVARAVLGSASGHGLLLLRGGGRGPGRSAASHARPAGVAGLPPLGIPGRRPGAARPPAPPTSRRSGWRCR